MERARILIIVGLILLAAGLSTMLYFLLSKEKYSQPVPDNNYIDIYTNEQIQLKRGSTAPIAVPPTVTQALYADKGLVNPVKTRC